MSACPVCQKEVDPLRARAVGVRDGKVVAYCSATCAASDESKPTRAPKSGRVMTPHPLLDSGPVIEIIRESSAPVGAADDPPAPAAGEARASKPKLLARRRQDSIASKSGFDWIGEEPADPAAAAAIDDDPAPAPARRSRGPWLALLVVVLAAGSYFAYRFVLERGAAAPEGEGEGAAPAPAPAPGSAAPAEVAPPRSAAPAPEAMVARAKEVLARHLTANSDNVQQKAAVALARTGDAAALAHLAAALPRQDTHAGKVEVAYALARAGDKAGTDALAKMLSLANRDDRAEAARKLVALRDPRAEATLVGLLGVTQHRLRAAAELAYVANRNAISVLVQVRRDTRSTATQSAEATIALAHAGQRDVTDELRALLGDTNFKFHAAVALAALGEPAARQPLVDVLTRSGPRVEAAVALRRLEPAFDPAPLWPALEAALTVDKDMEQIGAAEVILVLAGPPAWADHP